MAGHSQFKNIMHRKGAQDAKRAKIFTKIIRELTVAAKEGGVDPNSNARLRSAIIAARDANMPKDNMDRAIKRAVGGDDGADYIEVRYEGYGPSGVAVIVETLTDNRNRTAADVRSAFSKFGGNLGETGSVSFQFDRLGYVQYPLKTAPLDAMFEGALEAGAMDVAATDDHHEVFCAADDLAAVRDALTQKYGEPSQAKLVWHPKNRAPVGEDSARSLLKLLDVLEDNDDVQAVYSNEDMDDDTVKALGL